MMAAMGVAFKLFPWVAQDPVLSYAWASSFVETFRWSSVESFVGTAEDAQNRKKAMAQAAAAQQGQAPGGQPGQPGAPPPGGAPPQPTNGQPQQVGAPA